MMTIMVRNNSLPLFFNFFYLKNKYFSFLLIFIYIILYFNMLEIFSEMEQVGFISDETQHNISYIKHNLKPKKYSEAESFFDEDNKNNQTIDIPCCRLHRH